MKIKDPPCPGCNGVVILTKAARVFLGENAGKDFWTIYCPGCEIQMIPQEDKKRLIRTWEYFTAAIAGGKSNEKSEKPKTKRPLTDVTRPFRFDEQHVNNVGVS